MIDIDYEPQPPPERRQSPLRPVIWLVTGLYCISVLILLLDVGDWSSGRGWLIAFWAFNCLPFLLLAGLASWLPARRRALIVIVATSLLNAIFGWFMLINALYVHTDAQSGLIFLGLPPMQAVVAGLGLGVGLYIDK